MEGAACIHEVAMRGPRRMSGPGFWGRRPSRLAAVRLAPQGDGYWLSQGFSHRAFHGEADLERHLVVGDRVRGRFMGSSSGLADDNEGRSGLVQAGRVAPA